MKQRIAVVAIQHPTEPNLFLHGLRIDNGKWALPGGHAHSGETMVEAARREAKEETGLNLKDLSSQYDKEYGDNHVHLFTHKVPMGFNLDATEDPDKEFLTFKWLDPSNHRNLHVPASKNILVEHLKGLDIKKSIIPMKGVRPAPYQETTAPEYTHMDHKFKEVLHPKTPPGHKAFKVTDPQGHEDVVFARNTDEVGKHIERLAWTPKWPMAASELEKASPYTMDVEPFHSHENFDPKKHDFIIRLHHRNKPVGFMAMAHRPNGVMPFNAEIDPKHRGQNHSIAMANFASKVSRRPLAQSPDMTPPAKAQWTKLQTSKLKVRKMELESYALAQELAKSTDEVYAKRASNSLALLYPVAVGGKRHRTNGVIHHISIKPFGPAEEFHPDAVDQLMENIDKYGFNQPLDAKKLRFIPHKLPAFGGGTHHVLLVSGLPPQYHKFQKDMNHVGHKIDRYLPHISIDKDMWHQLAAKGSDLSAADVGFQAHPAELRSGNQVLKTY